MDVFKLNFLVVGLYLTILLSLSKADTCGVSQFCFRSPNDCFPASECTYFVGWSPSNTEGAIDFELSMSGTSGYIALGFSKDRNMANSDIIACLSDKKILRYYASSRAAPTRQTDVGLSNEATTIAGGTITCSFTRQLGLVGETNYFDLNEPHFLILAKGMRQDESIYQHTSNSRYSSDDSYDFKSETPVTQGSAQGTLVTEESAQETPVTQGSAQGTPVTLASQPRQSTTERRTNTPKSTEKSSEDPCGESQSCLRAPLNCYPASSCTYFVGWSLSQNRDELDFEFTLSGNNGYVALGFSKNGEMSNSDIIACLSSGQLSRHYAISRATPEMQDDVGVSSEKVEVVDGTIKCSFTRQLSNAGFQNFFNLSQDHFIILAKGDSNGQSITQHSQSARYASANSLDFKSAPVSVGGSEDDNFDVKIKAHGSLMVIGWIGFVSIGIVTARYLKDFLPRKTICGKPFWFRFHAMCMITAWLSFMSSFILIFITLEGWVGKSRGDDTYYHAIIGTAAVGLGTLNPIMAIFRPHPGTPRRPIFNVLHFAVGFLGWLCAIVATFYGVRIYYNTTGNVTDIDAFNVLIGFTIFIVIMFVVFELHKLSTRKKETSTDNIALDSITDTPFEEHRNRPTQRMQEQIVGSAAVRNIMYFLYVIGVTLTVVYLVITIVIKDS
ncbi:ferric-chelate reductase 1-like [Antedon mediterranea]|uniref:ferric-chelate reductase 1-like n=1 Tax=Antedon mediterranea TaxID=105859 RepID=UPI003AF40B7E